MFDKLLAAGLGAVLSTSATAQTATASEPQSIVAALQAAGYAAQLDQPADGDPKIRSKSSGSSFTIFFYNCEKHRNCTTIQFYAGYDTKTAPTLEVINSWNREKRFARAYLDKSSDPVIEMDLDLDSGGMTRALFTDNLDTWTSLMAAFEKHIGW